MTTLFILEMFPTKGSKRPYIAGVFDSDVKAHEHGKKLANSPNAYWWSLPVVTVMELNCGIEVGASPNE